jgi:quercetin dioxygenase-like cupin family protein
MVIHCDGDVPETMVEMEGATDVLKTVLIGPDDGSNNIVMRRFKVLPGGHTPRHQHDYEHVVRVLSGEGMTIDASGGEYKIYPGLSLYVEPNEEHQFRNPFSEPLEFLCIIPGTAG